MNLGEAYANLYGAVKSSCKDCGWTHSSVTVCTKWLSILEQEHLTEFPEHRVSRLTYRV